MLKNEPIGGCQVQLGSILTTHFNGWLDLYTAHQHDPAGKILISIEATSGT
jgi:hypothetical protein